MANNQSTDTLAEWDFNKFHVQDKVSNQDYIGAHSVLIAAGPPQLSQISAQDSSTGPTTQGIVGAETDNEPEKDVVFPIGVIQNMQMRQNRQVQRIFEIGSERSYFIPGRLVGNLTLARVLYHGPSLLRALSAFYEAPDLPKGGDVPSELTKGKTREESDGSGVRGPSGVEVNERPGSNTAFFINMASEFFDRPIGLMFYLKDNADRVYGHFYVESAFINNHNFRMGAGTTVVTETAGLQFDRAMPIKVLEDLGEA